MERRIICIGIEQHLYNLDLQLENLMKAAKGCLLNIVITLLAISALSYKLLAKKESFQTAIATASPTGTKTVCGFRAKIALSALAPSFFTSNAQAIQKIIAAPQGTTLWTAGQPAPSTSTVVGDYVFLMADTAIPDADIPAYKAIFESGVKQAGGTFVDIVYKNSAGQLADANGVQLLTSYAPEQGIDWVKWLLIGLGSAAALFLIIGLILYFKGRSGSGNNRAMSATPL